MMRSTLNLFLAVCSLTVCAVSCTEEDPGPVTVPEASFGFEKLSINCAENCAVQFTNTSSGADSYLWDFGDGATNSTEKDPLHTFATAGAYEVTLVASKGDITDDTVITVNLGISALIVNTGNFGQGNGSISLYNEEERTIINTAVKAANGGAAIDAGIESLYIANKTGYILCNAADKIEFIDANTLEFIDNPITGIHTPRYMASVQNTGYVTCWGPYSPSFTLEESYVAVLDLDNRTIIDSLPCGAGPEGIISVGSRLFIANSYEASITVYDLQDESSTTIAVGAAPQHFEVDGDGMLWVSLGSFFGLYPQNKVGLQAIDPSDNSLDVFLNFPGISDEGVMTSDKEGAMLYFLTAESWPGTATNVYALNTGTKTIDNTPLVQGENFYGIGFNNTTGRLYLADAAGFSSPGRILVYNKAGDKLDEQVTSIGPFHMVF